MERGRLRVFLGAAPGVGKTYEMLAEGKRRAAQGADCVIGIVETHGRRATAAMAVGLEVAPRRATAYRGLTMCELDLDALLARRPEVALVDEFAHTNVPGSKHPKRYQDVDDLLAAGIDVVTTLNIQHIESLRDPVTTLTGITQHETVPDEVVRRADELDLVDISPDALRRRLVSGEIYPPDRIDAALSHYFRPRNLTGLRELSLLWLADRVDEVLERDAKGGPSWAVRERVVVGVSGGAESEAVIRRAARIVAETPGSVFLAVAVTILDDGRGADGAQIAGCRALVESLGGSWHQVAATDAAEALVRFAHHEHATQLLIGRSRRTGPRSWFAPRRAVAGKVLELCGTTDVHVVADDLPGHESRHRHRPWRRATSWPVTMAAVVIALAAVAGGVLDPGLSAAAAAGALAILATLAWSSRQVAGARRESAQASAESAAMAAIASGSLTGGGLPRMVEVVRETFGFDAVSVLECDDDVARAHAWFVVASSGERPPERPEESSVSAPLGPFSVLAARGRGLSTAELETFEAVAAQLAAAERERLAGLRAASAERRMATDQERLSIAVAAGRAVTDMAASVHRTLDRVRADGGSTLSPDASLLIDEADGSARRISVLVRELADLVRARAGRLNVRLRPVELADTVAAGLDDLGPGRRRLDVQIPDDLPDAIADASMLSRVVSVLVAHLLRVSRNGQVPRLSAGVVGDSVELRFDAPGTPGAALYGRPGRAVADPDDPAIPIAVAADLVEAVGGSLVSGTGPDGSSRVTVRLIRAAH